MSTYVEDHHRSINSVVHLDFFYLILVFFLIYFQDFWAHCTLLRGKQQPDSSGVCPWFLHNSCSQQMVESVDEDSMAWPDGHVHHGQHRGTRRARPVDEADHYAIFLFVVCDNNVINQSSCTETIPYVPAHGRFRYWALSVLRICPRVLITRFAAVNE